MRVEIYYTNRMPYIIKSLSIRIVDNLENLL